MSASSQRGGIDPGLLRRLYQEKRNIMEYLRSAEGGNDESAILAAYDMQAGSYTAAMQDPEIWRRNQQVTARFARLFERLGGTTLLHGGTGEAKTISHVVEQMHNRPARVLGFDISLSRLLYGRRYARSLGMAGIEFFQGSLLAIPIRDQAFDIVFTSHSMEPNGGRERDILRELYRVSRRWLVLREPSYELGNAATRAHIEKHGYVRGIPEALAQLGYEVVEHGLFGEDENPRNQSALTVIRRRDEAGAADWDRETGHPYASPVSGAPLRRTGEAYYSEPDCLVFPVLSGIPCLLAGQGVFSSKYLEFAGDPES
jgi:hypothetical protein